MCPRYVCRLNYTVYTESTILSFSCSGPDETCEALHEDYAMIKYPRGNWAFPSEKLFKVDKDNLVRLCVAVFQFSFFWAKMILE